VSPDARRREGVARPELRIWRPAGPRKGPCFLAVAVGRLKRLYVSPEGRGFGLGERLVDAVVKGAKRIGYREMRLDTLPSMTGAIALYQKFGFEPIEPYYETPVIGTIFMHRDEASDRWRFYRTITAPLEQSADDLRRTCPSF
jgi:ribosomal protein S18 acetylase RimI-like enzyme